ncbi:MAG: tyrosine-type recombinase/integrase [Pseudomonadota bacterium]
MYSRQAIYNAWRKSATDAGIETTIGTHTPRKTAAYLAYKAGIDIEVIAAWLGHRSTATTRAYLGITQAEIDECAAQFGQFGNSLFDAQRKAAQGRNGRRGQARRAA